MWLIWQLAARVLVLVARRWSGPYDTWPHEEYCTLRSVKSHSDETRDWVLQYPNYCFVLFVRRKFFSVPVRIILSPPMRPAPTPCLYLVLAPQLSHLQTYPVKVVDITPPCCNFPRALCPWIPSCMDQRLGLRVGDGQHTLEVKKVRERSLWRFDLQKVGRSLTPEPMIS